MNVNPGTGKPRRWYVTIFIGFIAGLLFSVLIGDGIDFVSSKIARARFARDVEKADTLLRSNKSGEAITLYSKLLAKVSVEKDPAMYARLKNNLAEAYFTLAPLKDTSENLNNAIMAYQDALKLYDVSKLPIQYAQTQNNLGNCYNILADLADRKANLEKAIAAYQEAMRVYNRKDYPEEYQGLSNNLKSAQQKMAYKPAPSKQQRPARRKAGRRAGAGKHRYAARR